MVLVARQSLRQRILVTRFVSHLRTNGVRLFLARMATFTGHRDVYNGVTVDSSEEQCSVDTFKERLDASLDKWQREKRRTIWFRVHLHQTSWVPELAERGFKFHHAKEESVTMYKWISTQEECNLPPYAHTNLGAGAFVYNEETEELLVIKERFSSKNPFWKLPGGYVEPGEDIETAVRREVFEETGVQAEFKCLVAFRHGHGYAFGCSDVYLVAYLTPSTTEIRSCAREISECKWMKLAEYAEHPEVHTNNQAFARKLQQFLEHRMGMRVERAMHPISKKPIAVYSVSKVES